MNIPRALAATAAALTLTLAPSTVAHGDDDGPGAVLAVMPLTFAGLPTVFSALESGGGDIRGLVLFEYDFDGDGTVDLATESAFAEHTYPEVGAFTATLTVTDEFKMTSTTSIEVTVAPIETIGPALTPSEGASAFAGASLLERTAPVAGTITLVGADAPDLNFTAALVAKPTEGADPWEGAAFASYGPHNLSSPTELKLPKQATPGEYILLFRTSEMQVAELNVTIITDEAYQAAESEKQPQAPVALIVTGLTVVAIALGLGAALRYQRRKKATDA